MATKTDFTENEWKTLEKGVTGAGLLVSVADRGFLDTFKEADAIAKHLADARETSRSELVRDLAELKGRGGFGLTDSPQEVETETLEALRSAMATLRAKAPDEADAYRDFVVAVAESVARGAKDVGAAESDAIEKLRGALTSDPG